MNFSCMRAPCARLRGTPPVRAERTTSLPRGSVLHRCSPVNAPSSDQQLSRATAKPLKPGLVGIAGDLHLHIDAINVHLSSSNPPPAGQQDVASMLRSAVPDTITAAVTATQSPTPTPVPASTPSHEPFSCVGTMNLSQPEAFAMAMCSDGHSFVCGHNDGPKVALWDVRKPAQWIEPMPSNDAASIGSVAVSGDGRRIIMGCDIGLWLWDTWQGRTARLFPTSPEIGCLRGLMDDLGVVAITPDGRYAVAGGYSKLLQVWDLQTETCIANADTGGIVVKVAIAPDGRTAAALVAASDKTDNIDDIVDAASVSLWEWGAESGFAPPLQLQCTMWSDPWWVGSAMSVDGSKGTVVLALEWADGVVHRWNSQSGNLTVVLQGAGQVNCLALSADGRRAVLGYDSGLVRVWDVQGDTCLATLHHGDTRVTVVAMSADGRHAVSYSSNYGSTCVWHLG